MLKQNSDKIEIGILGLRRIANPSQNPVFSKWFHLQLQTPLLKNSAFVDCYNLNPHQFLPRIDIDSA